MKKLLLLFLALLPGVTSQGATNRVSDYPAWLGSSRSDRVLLARPGVTNFQATVEQLFPEWNIAAYGADTGEVIDSTLNSIIAAIPDRTPIRVPKGDYYVSSVTNTSKNLVFLFDAGARFLHVTNAVGHMLHMAGGSIKITNGTLDGNKANQASTSTNWFAILYGKEWDLDGVTLTNFMRAAILDFQTERQASLRNSSIWNGKQILTNDTFSNSAIDFSPAGPNTTPRLILENVYCENEAVTGRLPGGVFLAGSDANSCYLGVSIHGLRGNRVGDDHVVGAAHYGRAFLDSYEDVLYLHGEDIYLTNSRYIGLKIQNAQDASLSKFEVHTTGTEGINYTPGERLQTDEYWGAVFRDGKVYGDPLRTLGVGIHAGFSGGFHNVTLDNVTVTNCMRGYQVEGFTDIGTLEGYGPVTIRDPHVYVTNHNALEVFGYSGRIGIYGGELVSTGANAVRITETNSAADVEIIGTKLRAEGAGWALRVHGVKSLIGFGNSVESTGGEAVELKENTEGQNIQRLVWGDDNTVVAGTVDITAADIDSGYFTQSGTRTFYPSGLQDIFSGSALSYLRELRDSSTNAALLLRLRNDNPAGAAIMGIRVGGDVVGQFSAYGTNYSDADRSGWLVWRAENIAGVNGLRLDAPFSAKKINFRAGDTTTRFEVDGGGALFPTLTGSRVLVLDANKNAAASSVTATELGVLGSGIDWSEIQNIPAGFADGTDDGGGGSSDNWVAVGSTNSSLPGVSYQNSGVFTNGASFGSGVPGLIEVANGGRMTNNGTAFAWTNSLNVDFQSNAVFHGTTTVPTYLLSHPTNHLHSSDAVNFSSLHQYIDPATGFHSSPETTNPYDVAASWSQGQLKVIFCGATMELDLPSATPYAGLGLLIYNTGAFTITLDPNGSEVIVRDGTVQTGGVSMTLSSGAGNYVALISDGARWITLGFKGTLAAGS
jgi:hypothetical protein